MRVRKAQVTREHVPRSHVGGSLNVGMAALGIDTAARHPDVAEDELEHGGRVNQLHRVAVLRPAQRIQDGPLPVGLSRGADDRGGFFELLGRAAADRGHGLGRVARTVLFHQLENAAGVLQGRIDFRVARGVELIVPAGFVVALLLLVPAGEEAF